MPDDKRHLDELSQSEINALSDEELMARIEVEQTDEMKAREYHNGRSPHARVADESFKSTKITENYETWRSAPSQYDFPGVDTVAPEYKERRARKALGKAKKVGLVSEIVEAEKESELPGSDMGSTSATTRGNFDASQKKIGIRTDKQNTEEQAETLAHEIGHAVDHGEAHASAGTMTGLGLGPLDPVTAGEKALDKVDAPAPDTPVADELKDLTEERRQEITDYSRDYYEQPTELAADFFGAAITEPRNTKARTKESRPAFAEALEESAGKEPTREFADEIFPGGFF